MAPTVFVRKQETPMSGIDYYGDGDSDAYANTDEYTANALDWFDSLTVKPARILDVIEDEYGFSTRYAEDLERWIRGE